MNRCFWFGFFTHYCFANLQQDALGKEKYLKLANEYWIDSSIWFWLAVYAFGTSVYLWKEYGEKKLIINNVIEKLRN